MDRSQYLVMKAPGTKSRGKLRFLPMKRNNARWIDLGWLRLREPFHRRIFGLENVAELTWSFHYPADSNNAANFFTYTTSSVLGQSLFPEPKFRRLIPTLLKTRSMLLTPSCNCTLLEPMVVALLEPQECWSIGHIPVFSFPPIRFQSLSLIPRCIDCKSLCKTFPLYIYSMSFRPRG